MESVIKDLHLPTGWAPLEEVLHFILVVREAVPFDPFWDTIRDESFNNFVPPPGER